MITFIPRNIGLWRSVLHFGSELDASETPRKYFQDKQELICFLEEHCVTLNDLKFPLKFIGPQEHHVLGDNVYDIIQWSLLGWIKVENDNQ